LASSGVKELMSVRCNLPRRHQLRRTTTPMPQWLRTADVVDLIAIAHQIRIDRCSGPSAQKSTGDYSDCKADCPRHVWVGGDLDFHGMSFIV
jgi:hypothetical protein